MRTKVAVAVLSVFALMLFATVAEAVVLRVVTVATDQPDAYSKEIQRAQPIRARLGLTGVVRVWKARFAGSDTGAVVVSIEYADMAALAKDEATQGADAEYKAWLGGLDKLRKVVSDSVYEELKK